MQRTSHHALAAFLGLLFTAGLPAGRAQSASLTTAVPAASETAGAGEVIVLGAFNVSASSEHGYVASETTTGTRIASEIVDLPFAVNVVTSEFLKDFSAFDQNSQMAFVSGFSPSEVSGQYQLRGFQNSTSLVDGFRRIGLVDTSDITRIEIIKGPAASIYGATQPGGIVNYITPQPTATPQMHVEADVGGDRFVRDALSASGPIGSQPKFFYLVGASFQSNAYQQEFATKRTSDAYAKLLYKPSERTSLSLSLEHYELYAHPFVQVLTVTEKQTMPWVANSITESQYYGMATTGGLLDYNYAGPESYQHIRVSSATISFQHIFSEVWSIKFGANAFVQPYNDQVVGSGAYYPYGTGNVTVVNGVVQQPFAPTVKDQPAADWNPQRGGGMQLDNLFTFKTGLVSHKLLVTADYYELSQRTEQLVPEITTSGGTSQATDYYALYSPYTAPASYTPFAQWSPAMGYGWNTTLYGQNPALYNGVTTDQWLASGDYGAFVSENASIFHDRVTFLAGGRWDYVRNQVKNYNFNANGQPASATLEPTNYQAFDYNTSAWTYQLGGSVKVVDGFNLYANKSTAFNPQPQINSATGNPLPNNLSNGYEFGFKTSLDHGRVDVTVDRFVINEFNIVQNETDPVTSLKDTILIDEEQAKGYELDFNYQVTSNFLIGGNWGYTKAAVVESNVLTFLTGLPARRVPRDNVGVYTRYQFSHGPLKGLFLTADCKYFSKSLVNLGSGKSIVAGPASTSVGSTSTMYYLPSLNQTLLTSKDPLASSAGDTKITGTPVNNVPFPGNGLLPYPALPAGALLNTPVGANGQLLNQTTTTIGSTAYTAWQGEAVGTFVDDGREYNFNAPYAVFDMGAGYTWTSRRRFVSTLRVSATNIGNRAYTYGSGAAGQPFQLIATYNLSF